ncbi:MAG TPA: competence type IV pilus minor pilin ComGG [Virgibacillus sp.]|nr:competence type IV pilus minor pilin ComGG [Virgibacillus sp.]
MKKQLSFMNNSGFILPYVLFIITIILIVLSASIHIYKQEINMTHHHIEQLKIETLIQMSIMAFKDDYLNDSLDSGSVTYNFPYGTVHTDYSVETTSTILMQLTIRTDEHSSYQTNHVMTIKPNDINVDSFQHLRQIPQ